MEYSDYQRDLVKTALLSMLPDEPFWTDLGSGQKTNATESVVFYCKSDRFAAENEKEAEAAIAKRENDEDPGDYEYKFKFVWHVPGTDAVATYRYSINSAKFEAAR